METPLDLNSFLISNPVSTFFMRVIGSSMDPEISEGDIVAVDKSCNIKNSDIVIAEIEGEFTLKRFHRKNGSIYLIPDNKNYPVIKISESTEGCIWGKIIGVVRKY